MKLLVPSAAVLASLLLLAAADPARFLPTGEVYEDAGGEHRLSVRSWSVVQLRDGDETFQGTFEMLVDGKVQVTLEAPGRPRSLYYLRVEEGLREIEPDGALGRLLYDRDHSGQADGNRKRQRQTVTQMRVVGAAWLSWLTDQLSAAPAGSSMHTYDLSSLTDVINGDSLRETLFPEYLQRVPVRDGWGNEYTYFHASDIQFPHYMAIHSGGRDGSAPRSEYVIGPFEQTDYDHDIVWADGYFISYPGHPED